MRVRAGARVSVKGLVVVVELGLELEFRLGVRARVRYCFVVGTSQMC
jgi:hypothetical protein